MSDNLRTRIAAVIWNELALKSCGLVDQYGDNLPGEELLDVADAVIEALDEHQQREACGGCRGLGGHSPRCHTQPGALWRRLADMAESLGDQIGGNDTTMANRAYDLSASLKVRGGL